MRSSNVYGPIIVPERARIVPLKGEMNRVGPTIAIVREYVVVCEYELKNHNHNVRFVSKK